MPGESHWDLFSGHWDFFSSQADTTIFFVVTVAIATTEF